MLNVNGSKMTVRSGGNILDVVSPSCAYAAAPRPVKIATAIRAPSKTVHLVLSLLVLLLIVISFSSLHCRIHYTINM